MQIYKCKLYNIYICRFVVIFDNLTYGKYMSRECKFIITAIRGTASIHFMLDHAAATLERALATLKVSKYEKINAEKSWLAFCFARVRSKVETKEYFIRATLLGNSCNYILLYCKFYCNWGIFIWSVLDFSRNLYWNCKSSFFY